MTGYLLIGYIDILNNNPILQRHPIDSIELYGHYCIYNSTGNSLHVDGS